MTDEIASKIKQLIATVTGLETADLPPTTSFVTDLKLDSISVLEVIVDIEYQFRIKIPNETLGQLRTLDDTVRMVQQCLAEVTA